MLEVNLQQVQHHQTIFLGRLVFLNLLLVKQGRLEGHLSQHQLQIFYVVAQVVVLELQPRDLMWRQNMGIPVLLEALELQGEMVKTVILFFNQ
jgi:hypothetical protein